MHLKFNILATFVLCINLADAQNTLPNNLKGEAEKYQEAIDALRFKQDRHLLEEYIENYPVSQNTASAKLLLEKVILSENKVLPLSIIPEFTQLTSSEREIQTLYLIHNSLRENESNLIESRDHLEGFINQRSSIFHDEAHYYLGYFDYCEGNYSQALRHFGQIKNLEKYNNSISFYRMQIAYLNRMDKEVFSLITALEDAPYLSDDEKLEIDRIKAETLLKNGNNEEALKIFTFYINECENPLPSSAYNCGVLAFNKGNFSLAEKALKKATVNASDLVRQYSYMLLGQTYLCSNDMAKAQMSFEQAAAINTNPEIKELATYNKAVIAHHTSYSPWGDDVKLFEEFLNSYPESKYCDNISSYLTDVYLTTKNYDAALKSINKIKNPSKTIIEAKQNLLYLCGIQDYVNADYISANKNFTESLNSGSEEKKIKALSYYWRGESRMHLNKYNDALNDFKNFNTISSNLNDKHASALGYYSIGYAYYKKQEFTEARKNFEKYISYPIEKGNETYYDALARLGDCSYYLRDFVNAASYYEKGAAKESRLATYCLFQEAFMCGLQKKYVQKQNLLDRIINTYPDYDMLDNVWLEKGSTAVLQNETETSINAFNHVIEHYPDSKYAPQAAIQLAMVYNNSGETAKAQEIYQMVAERYPDTEESITAVQDLKTISYNNLLAEMPVSLKNKDYSKVIENYNKLIKDNVDFRELQYIQLLAAKACIGLGLNSDATDLLQECSQDTRTESGAEAKYLFAQIKYDNGSIEDASRLATELVQSGTPYQYWLARAIILISDINVNNGDEFMAKEYLKSLQMNYSETDDIQNMINSRLEKLN